MEAYSEVYAPQEVDEAVKGADPEMRKAAAAERRAGDKRLSPSKAKGYAAHAMQQAAYVDKKTKGKHIPGYAYAEEVDIFDIVLEFLQAEGYAETLEQAEWMMVNELDSEDIDAIVIGEADSLAAFQARREKRRAAMKKKTGYEGHDYSKPHAQAAAEREQRMRDFLDKK